METAEKARTAAAQDRRAAAEDREHAARDRAQAAAELALEGVDHLTGALRRAVGLAAVQREMSRSIRDVNPLVLAFADVDGLKRTNDEHGHAAGDRLLRDVSLSIQAAMRSYDVLVRFGGDEFVCVLAGDLDSVRERFEQVAQRLRTSGSSITVGLAGMRPGEPLEDLLARADTAMRAQRASRSAGSVRRRPGEDRRLAVRSGAETGRRASRRPFQVVVARSARVAAVALAVAVGAVALGVPAQADDRVAPRQRTALLLAPHQVRRLPTRSSAPIARVRAERPITGRSTILPVLAARTDVDGRAWLRVRLPGRVLGQSSPPRTGWLRATGTVRLSTTWHVLIRLSSREVIVFHAGRRARTFSAVVGAAATPTPRGEYFVEEPVRLGTAEPGAPFAFALSARSEVLQEFEGGPGQIALHGRRHLGGQPGTAASHGCIRVTDRALSWLSGRIGRGVPVTIY